MQVESKVRSLECKVSQLAMELDRVKKAMRLRLVRGSENCAIISGLSPAMGIAGQCTNCADAA